MACLLVMRRGVRAAMACSSHCTALVGVPSDFHSSCSAVCTAGAWSEGFEGGGSVEASAVLAGSSSGGGSNRSQSRRTGLASDMIEDSETGLSSRKGFCR